MPKCKPLPSVFHALSPTAERERNASDRGRSHLVRDDDGRTLCGRDGADWVLTGREPDQTSCVTCARAFQKGDRHG